MPRRGDGLCRNGLHPQPEVGVLCAPCRKASKDRYNASDKARAAKASKDGYNASDKARAAKARYRRSEKGRLTYARYAGTTKDILAREAVMQRRRRGGAQDGI
jgi:hypothetical protein